MSKKLQFVIVVLFVAFLTACTGQTTNNDQQSKSKSESNENSKEETFTLKLAGYHATTNIVSKEFLEYYINRVHELTDGQVIIDYFPAEQMGKSSTFLDLLKSGAIDMANISPNYYSDRMPLNTVIGLPNMFQTAEEGSLLIWNLLKNNNDIGSEFSNQGIYPLAASTMLPTSLFTVDKEIKTLEDAKGLKIRVPGGTSEFAAEAIGGIPVKISAGEMYSAFERKTLNAGFLSVTSWQAYQLEKFIKYSLDNISFNGDSNIISINTKVFEKLPENIQKAMEQAGIETIEHYSKYTDNIKNEIMKELQEKNGIEFIHLSDDQLKKWNEKLMVVQEKWLKNLKDNGIDGKMALDAAIEERDKLRE